MPDPFYILYFGEGTAAVIRREPDPVEDHEAKFAEGPFPSREATHARLAWMGQQGAFDRD